MPGFVKKGFAFSRIAPPGPQDIETKDENQSGLWQNWLNQNMVQPKMAKVVDGYLKVSDWVYLDSYFAVRRRAFERVNGPLELEGSDEEVDADD